MFDYIPDSDVRKRALDFVFTGTNPLVYACFLLDAVQKYFFLTDTLLIKAIPSAHYGSNSGMTERNQFRVCQTELLPIFFPQTELILCTPSGINSEWAKRNC